MKTIVSSNLFVCFKMELRSKTKPIATPPEVAKKYIFLKKDPDGFTVDLVNMDIGKMSSNLFIEDTCSCC